MNTCGTCRHWKPGPKGTVMREAPAIEFPGHCHRYPPDASGRRPRTEREEHCGEWSSLAVEQALRAKMECAAPAPTIESVPPAAPDLFTLNASQERPDDNADVGATAQAITPAGAPAAPEGDAQAGPPSGRKRRSGSRS